MLHNIANQTGLNIITTKTQVMCISPIGSQLMAACEEFTYLESSFGTDNAVGKILMHILGRLIAPLLDSGRPVSYVL